MLWNNLGVLLLARGDLAGAEQALARALAIAEATEPDWLLAVRGSIADLAARRSR